MLLPLTYYETVKVKEDEVSLHEPVFHLGDFMFPVGISDVVGEKLICVRVFTVFTATVMNPFINCETQTVVLAFRFVVNLVTTDSILAVGVAEKHLYTDVVVSPKDDFSEMSKKRGIVYLFAKFIWLKNVLSFDS